MNIVVEKQPNCVATLRVEIPAEKVQGERTGILRSFASKANIPGFRPGKAPLAVVEKRYAKDISEELHDRLVNEAFDEALKQEDLKVLDFGMPENITDQPDGSISFASKLTLAPVFQLPEYKGITVNVPPLEVPEEELQAQLKGLQERFADFKDIEDRSAAMGDFAVIDYSSTVDGQPTDEFLGRPAGYLSGRDGFWVRLDEQAFLPGFAAQLEGMHPGDSREINLTMPEDFPVEEMKNREVRFAVSLKELKEAELPALDNEFAAKLAPGKTMEEITEIIRGNLNNERQRKIGDMKVEQIVDHINSQVEFELPEDLLMNETQNQADAMVNRGVEAGLSEDDIASQQAEIFSSASQRAVTNLRTNFILQEIAIAEKLRVEDRELVDYLLKAAASNKVAPKKFIKDLQRAERLPSIRSSLLIGKTIDFLVSQANVVELSEMPVTEEEQ